MQASIPRRMGTEDAGPSHEPVSGKTGVFWHGKEAFRKGPVAENTSFLTWFFQVDVQE